MIKFSIWVTTNSGDPHVRKVAKESKSPVSKSWGQAMATETVGERSPYHLVMTNIAMEAMAM